MTTKIHWTAKNLRIDGTAKNCILAVFPIKDRFFPLKTCIYNLTTCTPRFVLYFMPQSLVFPKFTNYFSLQIFNCSKILLFAFYRGKPCYWYYKVLPEVFFTFITLLTGLSNLKKLLSNRLSMDGTELSKNGKAFEKIEDEDQKLIVSKI